MEQFLGFFISNDSLVVSILVAVIAITLLLLMIMSFRNPEGAVLGELGSTDNSSGDIEGTLRRVLGEQRWMSRSEAADSGEGEDSSALDGQISQLEGEVLEKDQQIADLNKQLTQGGGKMTGGGDSAAAEHDDSELQDKIKGLQDRLKEYEIIEDDIADLSLYKSENQKLKDELASLQAGGSGEVAIEQPADEAPVGEIQAGEAPVDETQVGETHIPESEPSSEDAWAVDEETAAPSGKDLVAEFEKVVNNQEASDTDFGDVDLATKAQEARMENVTPDSKEEAEVLIEDLKLLKLGKKE